MNVNVEILRKAARLMRERATAATPAPWKATGNSCIEAPSGFRGRVVASVGAYESGWPSTPDAEHIASWHPDVALAVAAWIDSHAADLASANGDRLQTDSPGDLDMALKVARAYLAGEWS